MSYISLFSVAIFITFAVSGCVNASDKLAQVSSEDYGASNCWLSDSQTLEAFLVLANEDRAVVPYLVSSKCLVNDNYSSEGEATLHHLNAVRLSDSRGTLRQALKLKMVSDNVSTDQPLPSSSSKVYYISGKVIQKTYLGVSTYTFTSIKNLSDSGISFEKFLGLTSTARQSLRDKYAQ